MSKSEVSKMGLGTFIGLTMALCATVRSIPTLAAVGWTLIFIQFLQFCFCLGPISMVSGELSTMLPQEGGPQLWVKQHWAANGDLSLHGYYGCKCSQVW